MILDYINFIIKVNIPSIFYNYSVSNIVCCHCRTLVYSEIFTEDYSFLGKPKNCFKCGCELKNGMVMRLK